MVEVVAVDTLGDGARLIRSVAPGAHPCRAAALGGPAANTILRPKGSPDVFVGYDSSVDEGLVRHRRRVAVRVNLRGREAKATRKAAVLVGDACNAGAVVSKQLWRQTLRSIPCLCSEWLRVCYTRKGFNAPLTSSVNVPSTSG